ncbi:MAG: hypothetical protein ACJ763_05025 [Bdellovibrionia bacterium]
MKSHRDVKVTLALLLTSPLLALASGCNFNQSSLTGAFSNSDASDSATADVVKNRRPRPSPSPSPTVTVSPTPTLVPGSYWVKCADENGTCTISGTRTVRYGTGSSWYTKTATGSIGCNNSVFGDSAPGYLKECDVDMSSPVTPSPSPTVTVSPTPSSNWVKCAIENGTCAFSGTHTVRYGAGSSWYTKTATSSIACTNAVFGDPAAGFAKECDVDMSGSATPPPSPSPTVTVSPSPTASPSVSPSPMPSPTVLPPVSVGSKITDIKVYATSSTVAQSNVPITFGIPFPKGMLPSGTSAILRDSSNQSIIPTQFEIKAKHDDGSARHAIVTAVLPQIGAGAMMSLDVVAAQAASQTSVDIATLFSKGFTTSVSVTISGTAYQATLNASNYASMQKGTWLQGALATEGLFKVPLTANGTAHPLLHARFYVRAYQGGTSARVGVAVENSNAYTAPANVTYDLQVQVGGQTVLSQAAVPHYAHSRWYRTFNYGTQSNVTVGLNPQFLLSSPAVPHYDPNLKIADSAIADWVNQWSTKNGLMQVGTVVAYMPTTGGRPDIGPLPSWNAIHVISQDPRMYPVAVGNGIQSGSWSIHYRDVDTDLPVSIDRYPYAALLGNYGDKVNPATGKYEGFPACASDCNTPYTEDTAHAPSLVYYPYLISGDYFLLEEMMFWGAYDLFKYLPAYRSFSDGLVTPDQVRGQAWSLRTLEENAYIMPDAHPYKAYFTDKLLKNIAWYDNKYVQHTDNVLGVITDNAMAYDNGVGMAPWQQHFFTWAIGNAYRMGFTTSKNFLMFLSKYQTSIMTDPSYCWIEASSYNMTIRTSSTAPYFTSFGDVYKNTVDAATAGLACGSQAMATQLGLQVGEMVGASSSTEGMPSNSQPALAVIVDDGAPNAQAAWNRFMARTVKPDYSVDPTWDIVPGN